MKYKNYFYLLTITNGTMCPGICAILWDFIKMLLALLKDNKMTSKHGRGRTKFQ